jgi:hypothetical protein
MHRQPEDQGFIENSVYNPFPQPQTIPAGWDLSGPVSKPQTDSIMDEDDSDGLENH